MSRRAATLFKIEPQSSFSERFNNMANASKLTPILAGRSLGLVGRALNNILMSFSGPGADSVTTGTLEALVGDTSDPMFISRSVIVYPKISGRQFWGDVFNI